MAHNQAIKLEKRQRWDNVKCLSTSLALAKTVAHVMQPAFFVIVGGMVDYAGTFFRAILLQFLAGETRQEERHDGSVVWTQKKWYGFLCAFRSPLKRCRSWVRWFGSHFSILPKLCSSHSHRRHQDLIFIFRGVGGWGPPGVRRGVGRGGGPKKITIFLFFISM